MIQVSYNGSNQQVESAVDLVNTLFPFESFLQKISYHPHFDLADVSPTEVANLIVQSDVHMSVDMYFSLQQSNDAFCYDDPDDATRIHLNQWTISRSVDSICNTIVHQCIHALNAANPNCYFGHGDNNSIGKEQTAPYWIAGVVQKVVANDRDKYEPIYHEDVADIPMLQRANSSKEKVRYCNDGLICFYDYLSIMGM